MKINQSWEKQYKRLSRDHDALKVAQDASSEGKEEGRSHKRRSRHHHHHKSDSALTELQSAFESSQRDLIAARERCDLLEKKVRCDD